MIDFESIPSDTPVTNQFESIGVRVTGVGPLSGLVISEGTFGSQNFGNSPTRIMHIGERDEPTTIRFVDPANPSQLRGATSFSVRLGDGDTTGEDLSVKYLELKGTVLATRQYSTGSGGIRVGESSASLGATIGSVELLLRASSPSGAAADDLTFQLYAPSQGYGFTKIAEAPGAGCYGSVPLRLTTRERSRSTHQPFSAAESTGSTSVTAVRSPLSPT